MEEQYLKIILKNILLGNIEKYKTWRYLFET